MEDEAVEMETQGLLKQGTNRKQERATTTAPGIPKRALKQPQCCLQFVMGLVFLLMLFDVIGFFWTEFPTIGPTDGVVNTGSDDSLSWITWGEAESGGLQSLLEHGKFSDMILGEGESFIGSSITFVREDGLLIHSTEGVVGRAARVLENSGVFIGVPEGNCTKNKNLTMWGESQSSRCFLDKPQGQGMRWAVEMETREAHRVVGFWASHAPCSFVVMWDDGQARAWGNGGSTSWDFELQQVVDVQSAFKGYKTEYVARLRDGSIKMWPFRDLSAEKDVLTLSNVSAVYADHRDAWLVVHDDGSVRGFRNGREVKQLKSDVKPDIDWTKGVTNIWPMENGFLVEMNDWRTWWVLGTWPGHNIWTTNCGSILGLSKSCEATDLAGKRIEKITSFPRNVIFVSTSSFEFFAMGQIEPLPVPSSMMREMSRHQGSCCGAVLFNNSALFWSPTAMTKLFMYVPSSKCHLVQTFHVNGLIGVLADDGTFVALDDSMSKINVTLGNVDRVLESRGSAFYRSFVIVLKDESIVTVTKRNARIEIEHLLNRKVPEGWAKLFDGGHILAGLTNRGSLVVGSVGRGLWNNLDMLSFRGNPCKNCFAGPTATGKAVVFGNLKYPNRVLVHHFVENVMACSSSQVLYVVKDSSTGALAVSFFGEDPILIEEHKEPVLFVCGYSQSSLNKDGSITEYRNQIKVANATGLHHILSEPVWKGLSGQYELTAIRKDNAVLTWETSFSMTYSPDFPRYSVSRAACEPAHGIVFPEFVDPATLTHTKLEYVIGIAAGVLKNRTGVAMWPCGSLRKVKVWKLEDPIDVQVNQCGAVALLRNGTLIQYDQDPVQVLRNCQVTNTSFPPTNVTHNVVKLFSNLQDWAALTKDNSLFIWGYNVPERITFTEVRDVGLTLNAFAVIHKNGTISTTFKGAEIRQQLRHFKAKAIHANNGAFLAIR